MLTFLLAKLVLLSHAGYLVIANASLLRGHPNDGSEVIDRHLQEANHFLHQNPIGRYLLAEFEKHDSIKYPGTTSGCALEDDDDDLPTHMGYIQLADGTRYTVNNTPDGWDDQLKSGHDLVHIPASAVIESNGSIDMHGEVLDVLGGVFDNRNLHEFTPEQNRNIAVFQRNLAYLQPGQASVGTRTVLAVRVLMTDIGYNATDQTGLSNDVFGNGVDVYNLKTQMAACSNNQLIINKAKNRAMKVNSKDGTTAISNGVVDIELNLTKAELGTNDAFNLVVQKLNEAFGVTDPSLLADHVMYCMPAEISPFIAWAWLYDGTTVYNNEWCNFLSTQMHEIGHNLGYGHSWDNGAAYDDQTGMMGYSYGEDEGPAMCFNSVKSWQTGWYKSKSKVINPASTGTDRCFEDNLYGIADFNTTAATTVLVKINDAANVAYYVTFNCQSGANSGTLEAGNQVTVTKATNDGIDGADSNLLPGGKLSAGEIWTGSIGGKTMTVTVLSITATNARVLIVENGKMCTLTQKPTVYPTNRPTSIPTLTPISKKPTSTPTLTPTSKKPTPIPSSAPTSKKPTSIPSSTPNSKKPTSTPTLTPTSTKPTSIPSSTPTSKPTSTPTLTPTSTKPTSIPSSAPTPTPTFLPSTSTPTYFPTTQNDLVITLTTSTPSSTPSSTKPSPIPTWKPTPRKPSRKPTSRKPSLVPTTQKPTTLPNTHITQANFTTHLTHANHR